MQLENESSLSQTPGRDDGVHGEPADRGRSRHSGSTGRGGGRRSWHRRASRPVSFWLVALLVVALAGPVIHQQRWLLVHMVTLGVATTSILVWGQYFTEAILHTKLGDEARRVQVWRIWTLQVGIATACVGMIGDWPWAVMAGATIVGLAVAWFGIGLVRQVHHALPGRFDSTVRFYAAAACLLPFGASLGAIMAFSPREPWRSRLLLAHQGFNILGFISVTVLGTLMTLWPTVLRTPMLPGQSRRGRRALWLVLAAVGVLTGGALSGLWWLAGAGVLLEFVALLVVAVDLVGCAARRPPRDYPGYAIGAAIVWFGGWLVWLLATIVAHRDTLMYEQLSILTPAVVMGFLLQLLLGAMSYLMPMVMGGGPSVVRATNARMHAFGATRAVLTNAGLLIWVLARGRAVQLVGIVTAGIGLAGFLPAMIAMVHTAIPLLKERGMAAARARATPHPDNGASTIRRPDAEASGHDKDAGGGTRTDGVVANATRKPATHPDPSSTAPPGRRSFVESVVGLSAVLGASAAAHGWDEHRANSAIHVAPTGHTTTIEMTAHDMRFHPDHVELPAGDRLVVKLTNTDPAQVHDLQLASGPYSGRLDPGQTTTLDAGVLEQSQEGWCTLVGHRSMGMTLRIDLVGATSPDRRTPASEATSPRLTVDLTQPPGRGFHTRDARLPPLEASRTHHIGLTVREGELEVAPATTLAAMTYNGQFMGPVLRARLGDRMQVHLVNDGSMGHSIDFHASRTSPDTTMRTISPGQSLDVEFTIDHAGIWLYHCSTTPMSAHIAAGMFGALIVAPADLPTVDRQYVLVQSETYLAEQNNQPVDTGRIADEKVDLTMFNGHANQYLFAPLQARVGERVRFWVLAAGPSRGMSFHIVGAQFDTVFKEGAYLLRRDDPGSGGSQALDLASCQGGFVETVFTEPGRYTFVNHSFVEMERGARGFIEVRP